MWGRALATLVRRLPSPAKPWVEGSRAVRLADDVVVLAAPSAFAKERLETRFAGLLTEALEGAVGRPVGLEVTIDERPPPAPEIAEEAADAAPATRAPRVEQSPLNPKYTFESFVIGPSNRFAHAAAQAVAEQPARSYNPLFIYGGAGLGKTHLLHAIGYFVRNLYGGAIVRYVSSEQFMNEFILGVREEKMPAFRRRYREADVLLVDDIQFLARGEQTQEEFFHTFNALHNDGRQIVISSDRPPKAIASLEDRLRTRFEWGLITDVQPPDLETRVAILQKKAQADGLEVPQDVLEFISTRVQNNIRELEGRLIRVVSYASLSQMPLTLDLAKEVLSPLIAPEGSNEIRPEMIVAECGTYFGIARSELIGPSRSRPLVQARQVAMYLCRELTPLSLPKIGEIFGGRDHTTVLHADGKIRKLMGERRQVYAQVQELTARLRQKASTQVETA
ncbi:MAG: chromosomal replication initiator protein DnaA [Actinomycetota bacterium]|nr:chromosomal replication initiator protein DnaA [Actinomycetota bacterium]